MRNNAVIYTAFRIIGGAGFAVLLANTVVFVVAVFGVENNGRILSIYFAIEPLTGLGPSLAWILRVHEVENGRRVEQSYEARSNSRIFSLTFSMDGTDKTDVD